LDSLPLGISTEVHNLILDSEDIILPKDHIDEILLYSGLSNKEPKPEKVEKILTVLKESIENKSIKKDATVKTH
jgi:hypothetical protein